jgi:hypothetical protein
MGKHPADGNPPSLPRTTQSCFDDGGYQRIGLVDHVAHVQSTCLGEQLPGAPAIVAVSLLQPQDQLDVRDAGRVYPRTGAPAEPATERMKMQEEVCSRSVEDRRGWVRGPTPNYLALSGPNIRRLRRSGSRSFRGRSTRDLHRPIRDTLGGQRIELGL